MLGVGPLELAIVLIIALIVLGPQRLPDVAKSAGRGIREFKDALAVTSDDERPPRAEVRSAPERVAVSEAPLEALAAALTDSGVLAEESGVAAVVRVDASDGASSVSMDFRRGRVGGAADQVDLTVTIESGLVHAFLLGELHEPTLLLKGQLAASGPLDMTLRFLPALPALSRVYRERVGENVEDPPRFAVLRHVFKPPPLAADPNALPQMLERDDPSHQAAVAAAIVLGLPPACRGIEIGTLFGALERGDLEPGPARAMMRRFGALSQRDAVEA